MRIVFPSPISISIQHPFFWQTSVIFPCTLIFKESVEPIVFRRAMDSMAPSSEIESPKMNFGVFSPVPGSFSAVCVQEILKRKINEDINEKRNRVILFFYKTTQFLLKCDLRQISK